jgi:hypothetical protein
MAPRSKPIQQPQIPHPSKSRSEAVKGISAARRRQIVVPDGGVVNPAFPVDIATQIEGLMHQYAPLAYNLPWEILDYIEILATYNPDYSQAIENIRNLANSGHAIFVDGQTKAATIRIKSKLDEKARMIQESHGGIDGLIDKLLDQACTFGAMCFSADTNILTNRGVRPIGELVGTTVKVMTRGGCWTDAPISSFGEQRLWKIVVQHGKRKKDIYATGNHRWLLQSSKGEDGAYAVRPPKGISRKLSKWEIEAQTVDLCPGDRLVVQRPDQQRGNLFDIDMSAFGVARGIIFGDGCSPNSKRGVKAAAGVGLYGDKSDELIKWFPLSTVTTGSSGEFVVRGLPRYWKQLPDFDDHSGYILGWLAGYFAVDGSMGSTQCSIKSSKKEHIEFVRDCFVRLGVSCSPIKDMSGERGGGLVRKGHYEYYGLSFKTSDLPEYFFIRPSHRIQYASTCLERPWTVVSIEKTDRIETVYCATVDKFHCFVLEDNILTGNCGEWTISENLDDVVGFVDINPKYIRYFWDNIMQRWRPFQKVSPMQAREALDMGQEIRQLTYVALNEATFQYYAFDSAPSSPYGVPPFLAALANIAIQRDMVNNMAQIVRKIGLLGIVDLAVEALPQIPGETDEAYTSRAQTFLNDYAVVVQDMMRDGGIVHFDDMQASVFSMSGNAAGATNIFKTNEELVFSGLKSMPSMQGRSYSTTETYAGVAYDIVIRNTFKYQRAAKRMVEHGYWLMCALWGENPKGISLHFQPNKALSRLQEAQAESIEMNTTATMWTLGLIDQVGAAQRSGINEPAIPMASPPQIATRQEPMPEPPPR